jgi:hypothetical protein
VVIEHYDVDAAVLEFGNFSGRSGAAVNRDQQFWAILLKAALDALATQPVALLHPQGQKQFWSHAVSTQQFREQHEGGHSIDIVISEQHDAFVRIEGIQNPTDCRTHLREQKWIAERAKTRTEESFNFLCAAKTFPKKQSRDAIGLANLTPGNAAAIQIFARRYNPSVLHRISLITAR